MKMFLLYPIVLLVTYQVCAMLSPAEDLSSIKSLIDRQILKKRKKNGVESSSIPEGFKAQEWGEIIRFNENYAGTHVGNLYYFKSLSLN